MTMIRTSTSATGTVGRRRRRRGVTTNPQNMFQGQCGEGRRGGRRIIIRRFLGFGGGGRRRGYVVMMIMIMLVLRGGCI